MTWEHYSDADLARLCAHSLALDAIAQELSGREWSADVVEVIAEIVRAAGFRVDDIGEDMPPTVRGNVPGWAGDDPTPASGATLDQWGAIHCQCGNIPDFDGFSPCDRWGIVDDDLLAEHAWPVAPDGDTPGALHYRCDRCGLIFGPWPSVACVASSIDCSECGSSLPESLARWVMAAPVCGACFDGSAVAPAGGAS